MTLQYRRNSSWVTWPRSAWLTFWVDSPVQTTSAKYMETWLKMPGTDAGIVGRREERHAGSQAGAEDADAAVAPGFQPVDAGPDIDGRLPAGVDGAADVAGNVVVGARGFGRLALGVVGHGHAQGADAEAIEQFSQADMAVGAGIPLRQDDQHPAVVVGRRKPLRRARYCFRGRASAPGW